MTLASKETPKYYIVSDKKVLIGPVNWNGKLIELARWYKNVCQFAGVKILQLIVDEEAI